MSAALFSSKLPERFWDKVIPEPMSGCWLWSATIAHNGYGRFGIGRGRHFAAHRILYEALVGPIPSGFEIDHKCRVRCCVNPAHLEVVTPAENKRRATGLGRRKPFPAHCKNGHVLDGENLSILRDGQWRCRACHRDRERERYRESKNAF